jgi:hypothetical protein
VLNTMGAFAWLKALPNDADLKIKNIKILT